MGNAVTESDAKTMACAVEPLHECFGTRCMAWRWYDTAGAPWLPPLRVWIDGVPPELRGYNETDVEKVKALPRPDNVGEWWGVELDEGRWYWTEDDTNYALRRVEHARTWPSRRTGFCGRAGNPNAEGGASFVLPSS